MKLARGRSADPEFETAFASLYETLIAPILNALEFETVVRVVVGAAFSVFFLAQILSWTSPYEPKIQEPGKFDSLVSGIVLGSVLSVYLFFLYIQFERIWISGLPASFKETEILVKSGFWQLFLLTLLNIGLFILLFKKTSRFTQRLLGLFTLTSLLLLLSSAYRMFLYVRYYGLSVEKFYASYTVLYCGILFALFLYLLLSDKRLPLLHLAGLLALWMYSFSAVIPMERLIVISNLQLAKMDESRLNMHDAHILSSAIAPLILKYGILKVREDEHFNCGKTPENNEQYVAEIRDSGVPEIWLGDIRWNQWIESEWRSMKRRRWYEHSVSSLLAENSLRAIYLKTACCGTRKRTDTPPDVHEYIYECGGATKRVLEL